MLQIKVPSQERYDPVKREFIEFQGTELQLEHSLISLSKWEAKWNKPFLDDKNEKTLEETIDYIKCMTLTQKVPDIVYEMLTAENLKEIRDYIDSPMTATCFSGGKNKGSSKKEIITSELIYYWLVAYQIPFECQKWHLNRLLTLIRVCSVKNDTSKKKSKGDTLKDYRAINAQRRAEAKARQAKGV